MGVTITLALAVWFASSLIEYKIVSNSPRLQFLFHGIPGIVISISIGALVGWSVGAAGGAGFILGQLLGLATNDFTFKMYTWLFSTSRKIKASKVHFTEMKQAHPVVFNDAIEGLKAGFKSIIAFVLFCVWVCGIPLRTYRRINSTVNTVKGKFHHA